MKHIDEIEDNINDLLLQKNFDQLNDEEKEKVLKHAANAEEYNLLRTTLLAITSSFVEEVEEEIATTEVKNDLMAQFQKKYGTQNNRAVVIPMYRKPYFQLAVAASIALLVFISFPLLNNNDQNNQLALNNAKAEQEAKTPEEANNIALNGETTATLTTEEKEAGAIENKQGVPGSTVADKESAPLIEKPVGVNNEATKNTITSTNSFAEKETNILEEKPIANKQYNANSDDQLDQVVYDKNIDGIEKSKAKLNETTALERTRDKKTAKKDRSENERKDSDLAKTSRDSKADNELSDVMAGTAVNAPVKATISAPANTETFVENNKAEMLNLLFTAF